MSDQPDAAAAAAPAPAAPAAAPAHSAVSREIGPIKQPKVSERSRATAEQNKTKGRQPFAELVLTASLRLFADAVVCLALVAAAASASPPSA